MDPLPSILIGLDEYQVHRTNNFKLLYKSFSRSSDGNSSLPDEGGNVSQVPQASVQLAGHGSVVWPDSLSEWLVGGAGLR